MPNQPNWAPAFTPLAGEASFAAHYPQLKDRLSAVTSLVPDTALGLPERTLVEQVYGHEKKS